MSSINFDNAWLLLIALPLIAVFVIPFAIAVRKENRNGHNVASIVLHVVLSAVIAFAAAGTNVTTVLTETEVYVVADVSYSANRNLDRVDEIIRGLELPRNSKVGLICFGKDPELLNGPTAKNKLKSVKEASVDDSETDIVGALEFAGGQFRDDVIKRLVLITDGRQTDESDAFAITRKVSELRMRNVKVDAVYLNDNLRETDREIQISSVEYTRNAYLNHEETAIVEIQVNGIPDGEAVRVYVTLNCSGEEPVSATPQLTTGTNFVSLPLHTDEAGTYRYEVTVRPEPENIGDDANPNNNRYLFTQIVSDEVKVLVVTSDWDSCEAAVERYGSSAQVDVYETSSESQSVKDAFIAAHPSARFFNGTDIPCAVEQLVAYDEIVLADMNVTAFENYTLFIGSVQKVVSTFGKSLVTAGNLQLQTLGTEQEDMTDDEKAKMEALQSLADLLPIRYGRSQDDSKLYTIVFDISRSMVQNFHFSLAKTVAKKLVGILNDNDSICIVTFAGEIWVKQPIVEIGNEANRARINELIDGLEGWQGTMIASSLREAQNQLVRVAKDRFGGGKQIMLITDGMSYGEENDEDLSNIAAEMYGDDGIITSVFDVGRQGDSLTPNGGLVNSNSTSVAQCRELMEIAEAGNGKYTHNTDAEGNISDEVFADMTGPLTETVVERTASVNIERRLDKTVSGLNAGLPEVGGYYYTSVKTGTTTVLSLNHRKSSGEIAKIPLYTYWNYGNGKVSSFASAYSGDWLNKWKDAAADDRFFYNVYEASVPQEKISAPYTLELVREGTVTRAEVTPAFGEADFDAPARITITYPAAEGEEPVVKTANMTFGSYSYFYEFDTSALGEYLVHIEYFNNGVFEADGMISISYAPEYDAFAGFDANVLHRAVDEGGVVSMDGKLSLENDKADLSTYVLPLTVPLLITAVALYVVDIVIRKLKWEDVKSFFGFGKKRKGGAKL